MRAETGAQMRSSNSPKIGIENVAMPTRSSAMHKNRGGSGFCFVMTCTFSGFKNSFFNSRGEPVFSVQLIDVFKSRMVVRRMSFKKILESANAGMVQIKGQ